MHHASCIQHLLVTIIHLSIAHRNRLEVGFLARRPFWETSTITWSTKHGLRHLPGRQHRPPSGAFGKTSTTLRFLQYLVKYANQKYIFFDSENTTRQRPHIRNQSENKVRVHMGLPAKQGSRTLPYKSSTQISRSMCCGSGV